MKERTRGETERVYEYDVVRKGRKALGNQTKDGGIQIWTHTRTHPYHESSSLSIVTMRKPQGPLVTSGMLSLVFVSSA